MAHTWIIGQSGTGKSTLMIERALQVIDETVIYFDPHGQDIDRLASYIPKHRQPHTILFDPSEFPIPINILDGSEEFAPLISTTLVDAFKSVWGYDNTPTPLIDMYLYNCAATLIGRGSLLGVYYLLVNEKYRKHMAPTASDPIVRSFWEWFESLSEKDKRDTSLSTVNKVQVLMADPRVRNVFGHIRSALPMKEVLKGKILLVRLPQGKLGLAKTSTIGALLLANIHATALANPSNTHIFIDECHHFGTGTLIEMLSGIRKFGVEMTVANQYLSQLSPQLRDAILGNVTEKLAFRTGLVDAQYLEPEFVVDNLQFSLAELPKWTARRASGGKLLTTPLPPPPYPNALRRITNRSRNQYGRSPDRIERFIQSL